MGAVFVVALRALLVAACALAAPALADDASELFARGEQAFAAEDYGEALRLFTEAREAGSAGPGVLYNIGVSQYLLQDYVAAEATFAALAAEFPAMRELAEYNRGLALRAQGDMVAARSAFERARTSADEKIAALAATQLGEVGVAAPVDDAQWYAYVSGGVGYDDNVALVDEGLIPGQAESSPLMEIFGVLNHDFGSVPLRLDASGYVVRYADAGDFDQSSMRLALITDRELGTWRLTAGPTIGSTTFDDSGFEEIVGADVRVRREIATDVLFDARLFYDRIDAGDARFDYLEGSRRQLRLGVQHTGTARVRVGYDVESNDRADARVSASRKRWTFAYQRRLARAWTGDAAVYHRTSRYGRANVPRKEKLLELSLAVRRELPNRWTLGADYRWSDNDSTFDAYSYERHRVTASLSRSFDGD